MKKINLLKKKYGWNEDSGSREEVENVNCSQTDERTTDNSLTGHLSFQIQVT